MGYGLFKMFPHSLQTSVCLAVNVPCASVKDLLIAVRPKYLRSGKETFLKTDTVIKFESEIRGPVILSPFIVTLLTYLLTYSMEQNPS
jgi:hypothetical protein